MNKSTVKRESSVITRPHFANMEVSRARTDFSIFRRIGETEGLMILDTGAQISLVDKHVKTGKMNNANIKITGVTGTNLTVYGKVNEQIVLNSQLTFSSNLYVTDLPTGYI